MPSQEREEQPCRKESKTHSLVPSQGIYCGPDMEKQQSRGGQSPVLTELSVW